MWENLLRVDWAQLTHAYGRARNMPRTLRDMISRDENARAKGWDTFWGAINHQGDFYDSTVAAVPFLIEAAADPGVPERAAILRYFRDRWLEAPQYGGDPLVVDPPGGVDIPTPLVTESALAKACREGIDDTAETHDDEEFDISAYRRMDLCAWQTGRAIQAGRATYLKLLDDSVREVAAAAASLLLVWPETRPVAKKSLIRTINEEVNPVAQGQAILEFGVYAGKEDIGTLAQWIEPHQPEPVRAAAALVWAWVVEPAPLPKPAETALREMSAPDCDAFAKLPWVGVFHRGVWFLPSNASELVLRLAENKNKEIRWRAVQGLAIGHESAKFLLAPQVVPVLIKKLSDDYNRIRAAAAFALSQRGEAVFDIEPTAVSVLIRALEGNRSRNWGDNAAGLDTDGSICGHAARLLAAASKRLTTAQRKEAAAGIDRAARRYANREHEYVSFQSMGIQAGPFLKDQREILLYPREPGLEEVFAAFAFPDKQDSLLSPQDCDRRLAGAYAHAPVETVNKASKIVREASDRNGAIGAALWLMTLGPAAQPALVALDGMPDKKSDPYAHEQVAAAAKFIRQSLLTTPDEADEPSGGKSIRHEIWALARNVSNQIGVGSSQAPIAELLQYLDDPDAYVRAGAADVIAMLAPAHPEMAGAIPSLEKMLGDEGIADVGIRGTFDCDGRLFHWRQERRSPRAGAIRALFALGHVPKGDRLLKAMLAESMHAKVICGKTAMPIRFSIGQWAAAVDAAGGLTVADPDIRATRQQCQGQPWGGNDAPYRCAAELSEIIRRLSGRLV